MIKKAEIEDSSTLAHMAVGFTEANKIICLKKEL